MSNAKARYKDHMRKLNLAKKRCKKDYFSPKDEGRFFLSDIPCHDLRTCMIQCKKDQQELMLLIRYASIPSEEKESKRREEYNELVKIHNSIFGQTIFPASDVMRSFLEISKLKYKFRSESVTQYERTRDGWRVFIMDKKDDYEKFRERMKLNPSFSSEAWKIAAIANQGFVTDVLNHYFKWEQSFGRYVLALQYHKEKHHDDDNNSIDAVLFSTSYYAKTKFEEDVRYYEDLRFIDNLDTPKDEKKKRDYDLRRGKATTAYPSELSRMINDIKSLDKAIPEYRSELEGKSGRTKKRIQQDLSSAKKNQTIFRKYKLIDLEGELERIKEAGYEPEEQKINMTMELKDFCAVTKELISLGFLTYTIPKFIPNPTPIPTSQHRSSSKRKRIVR